MNCCDYDCTQGRDCPARVARYKPVMLAAEPLPPSNWRNYLKVWAVGLLAGIVLLVNLPVVIYFVLRA